MDIRQRLHLSGMDSHAPELARKWGLGLEVTDFCYAPMLDDPATLPAVREKMAGIDHFWLHAGGYGAGAGKRHGRDAAADDGHRPSGG